MWPEMSWFVAPLARADSGFREVIILRVGYEEGGRFVGSSGEEVVRTAGVIVRVVGEFARPSGCAGQLD